MILQIYDNSKNYTCQVIKLPKKIQINGLDNLVEVNHQGNSCLISKDSPDNELYLFFPAESQISHEFLSNNNLYRNSELNTDKSKKGFFEDNRRVKAIKFKGIISSGFITPVDSLDYLHIQGKISVPDLKVGDEFNAINKIEICRKYIKKESKQSGFSNPKTKKIEEILDSKFVLEHPDTSHLFKNIHKLNLDNYIAISIKLHGTSARYYNTVVQKKLSLRDKIAKFFGVKVQETVYDFVVGSRRCIKSIGLKELPNKNHFYTSGDLWSDVGKEYFEGKLNQGEAVYCEIIGSTYTGEAIQHGYSYGFKKPKVFIYRISNINSQGIEVDLSYHQMKERCTQLGVDYCPELFYGKLSEFIRKYEGVGLVDDDFENTLNLIFYDKLLEKPSILDNSVVEEGFCIRIDKYPRPEIFKIKSKKFLIHEGNQLDKQEIIDIEEEQQNA